LRLRGSKGLEVSWMKSSRPVQLSEAISMSWTRLVHECGDAGVLCGQCFREKSDLSRSVSYNLEPVNIRWDMVVLGIGPCPIQFLIALPIFTSQVFILSNIFGRRYANCNHPQGFHCRFLFSFTPHSCFKRYTMFTTRGFPLAGNPSIANDPATLPRRVPMVLANCDCALPAVRVVQPEIACQRLSPHRAITPFLLPFLSFSLGGSTFSFQSSSRCFH
jgi:hypothetical protein